MPRKKRRLESASLALFEYRHSPDLPGVKERPIPRRDGCVAPPTGEADGRHPNGHSQAAQPAAQTLEDWEWVLLDLLDATRRESESATDEEKDGIKYIAEVIRGFAQDLEDCVSG
jgi:hypothetical protein